MADKRDYYEVLGVSKDADSSTIKSAYRKLAKKYHPDANPDDKEMEAKFKEASEAYAVLSDPEKRKQYDQFGHAAFDGGAGAGAGGFDFSNMGDIFSEFFGGGGGFDGSGFFSSMFGGGRNANPNVPRRGADIHTAVKIDMKEAFTGTKRKIDIHFKDECKTCRGSGAKAGTSPETCSRCNGSGQVVRTQQSFLGMIRNVEACPECRGTGKVIKEKCTDCRGTGYITTKKTIEVDIPAGIDNGQYVKISGYGDPGSNGGPRGDVLAEVRVNNDTDFGRNGSDLFSEVSISYATAVLGGDVKVNTIDGDIIYSVKAGTVSGTRVRLKNKGMPYVRNPKSRGDLYITLDIDVPKKLNKEQTEALQAFEATLTGNEPKVKKKKKGFF